MKSFFVGMWLGMTAFFGGGDDPVLIDGDLLQAQVLDWEDIVPTTTLDRKDAEDRLIRKTDIWEQEHTLTMLQELHQSWKSDVEAQVDFLVFSGQHTDLYQERLDYNLELNQDINRQMDLLISHTKEVCRYQKSEVQCSSLDDY